jgi:hypothetical protein
VVQRFKKKKATINRNRIFYLKASSGILKRKKNTKRYEAAVSLTAIGTTAHKCAV